MQSLLPEALEGACKERWVSRDILGSVDGRGWDSTAKHKQRGFYIFHPRGGF